jgi:hypothetical protein
LQVGPVEEPEGDQQEERKDVPQERAPPGRVPTAGPDECDPLPAQDGRGAGRHEQHGAHEDGGSEEREGSGPPDRHPGHDRGNHEGKQQEQVPEAGPTQVAPRRVEHRRRPGALLGGHG